MSRTRCVARWWRLEGEADHVHLQVEGPPSMDLALFVGNLQTVMSSRYLGKEFEQHLKRFFWVRNSGNALE